MIWNVEMDISVCIARVVGNQSVVITKMIVMIQMVEIPQRKIQVGTNAIFQSQQIVFYIKIIVLLSI